MTMLPVITAPSMGRYTHNDFPDVVPFTIREGASWESVLSSIRVWIRDELVPFLEETNPGTLWEDNAAALTDAVNAALKGATDQFQSMFNSQFTGSISAPAPTGDAATDTANLIAAFAAAKSSQYDLRLTVSPLGAVKYYKANQPLTWSLSRGSLIGAGHVGIDFSAISASYVGAALLVQGEQGNFNYGAHLSAQHRVEGIRFMGHNTDASQMDGVLVADTAGNIDQGRFVACFWYGFHDGITFGDNVWSIDFMKCAISSSHRYGLNLQMGSVSGECISLTHTSIFGTTNAAKAAAAIYAPAGSNVEFRMIGGSLDYNNTEGKIFGGALSFHAVHIEDNSTGAMFLYSQSLGELSVSFRDCAWDSSASSPRPYIHEILAGSGPQITLNFDGDKGGVYPNTRSVWVADNSGLNSMTIIVQHKAHAVTGLHLMGQPGNLATNGTMEPQSFVASPGYVGWYAASTTGGSWAFGPGGNPGAGLQLVSTSAQNHYAQQMVRIPTGRPIWVGGKVFVNAITTGGAELLVDFFASDGTTQVGTGARLGTTVTAQSTDWSLRTGRFMPPPGAAFVRVKLSGGMFVGTATFDGVEVVPI